MDNSTSARTGHTLKHTKTTGSVGNYPRYFGQRSRLSSAQRFFRLTLLLVSSLAITAWSASANPTAPTNLTASAVGTSQIRLSWTASTSSIGLASYTVQRCEGARCRNFSQVGTVPGTNTTYDDGGLSAATTYRYRVRATDSAGASSYFSNSASATTQSASAAPVITSATTASGAVGTAFSYQITATNSPISYSGTGLPSGLSINTNTGMISGTPTVGGNSAVTLGATNSTGTGNATLTISISGGQPVITSATTASGAVGTGFSYQITATNSPTSYEATGLPTGLSINSSTGLIAGTPTAAGTSAVTLGATNGTGTGNATLTISITNSGANSYTTAFSSPPAPENPISESGNWTVPSEHGDGSLWGDAQTASGGRLAYGVSEPTAYGDPTAVLTGAWGPDQSVQATIKVVSTPTTCCHEVELRLRTTISSNSISGYELLCPVWASANYGYQIVRWNGGNGQYVYIGGGSGTHQCVNGDVLSATISGTNPVTINFYNNGTLVATACDNGGSGSGGSCGGFAYGGPGGAAGPFASGTPGIGFYDNSDNNWSQFGFSDFSATDNSATDTTAPTMPTNLSATPVSSSQINLTWAASTDNIGVTGYQVFRDGVRLATTSINRYSDTGLTPNTSYTYSVAAYDAAGNVSAQSNPASATTPSVDTTPPSVPTNLQSSNVTSSSVTLTWAPSTDNVAVAGYYVYRNGIQVTTTSTATYTDKGLSSSMTYSYSVAAYDTSNNISNQSQPLEVTTAAGATAAPSLVQATQNEISTGTSVSASFNGAATAGNTIVVYAIWDNLQPATITDSEGDPFTSVGNAVTWWSGRYSAQVFYATNIAGGPDTITAAFRTSTSSFGVLYIHELSGVNSSNPIDVTVSASGASSTLNSGSATTTSANDLIFGAGVSDNTVTAAGTGFTGIDFAYGNITEARVAASTGSYSATASQYGTYWGMQMVAFRAGN
jgi:chitodextrinase